MLQSDAKFINKKELQAGEKTIEAKYFIIATGSSPAIPDIDGLKNVNYLTNEKIFDLEQQPQHLIAIGGGPIGTELAQAHVRLGAKVTQLVVGEILPRDDHQLVDIVRTAIINNGINLIENVTSVNHIEKNDDPSNSQVNIEYEANGEKKAIIGSHLLISAGRQANVNKLNLEAARVAYTNRGITVDQRLRSSNKKIYAIGDVIGPYQFTHIASYHASIVIRNILFKLPTKIDYRAITWVTYTDPEYAHVGLQFEQALKDDAKYRLTEFCFSGNDRAQTERRTEDKIKIITNRKGIVIGCDIVGRHAGELILPWSLAIQNRLSISKIANLITPYPTLSEISKRAAGNYYAPILFSKRTR